MTPDEYECKFITCDQKELIAFLFEIKFLKNEYVCSSCKNTTKFSPYKKNIDEWAWRCVNKGCNNYLNYFNIRQNLFFEGLRLKLSLILRVVIKYAVRQPVYSIKKSLDISESAIQSILTMLKKRLPKCDFHENKLGSPGVLVQIDETMLNYKAKSHRGRSPLNRSDSICIVEVKNHITRAFAKIIENKEQNTLIPIICNQVAPIVSSGQMNIAPIKIIKIMVSNILQFVINIPSLIMKMELIPKQSSLSTMR